MALRAGKYLACERYSPGRAFARTSNNMPDTNRVAIAVRDMGITLVTPPVERHPCVIVQTDVFNRSMLATSVVCLITSNLTRAKAPGNVLLTKGEANLPKASVVNVSQIFTVDKTELVEYSGNLSSAASEAVRNGLHLLLDGR